MQKRSLRVLWPAVLAAVFVGTVAAGAQPAHADDTRWVAALSAADWRTPDGEGRLERFGTGNGLNLMVLIDADDTDELIGGFELSAQGIRSDEGDRVYDLGLSIVGTLPVARASVVPFVALGLDMAAVSLEQDKVQEVGLGVHGTLGVHGFVGRSLYVRAAAGYLGAGLGAVKGELAVGYSFD